MIVVSAQLTDWHETSARQAIELTEYFLAHFPVDASRVYAAGYSAGGETMSLAVSMRPDLYAAYLHGASRWMGNTHPSRKTAWPSIFLWPSMMSTMVRRRHGPLTITSMTPMKKLAGTRNKSTAFYKFKHRTTDGLQTEASPGTITAVGMWYLGKRLFCTGFCLIPKRRTGHKGIIGKRQPPSEGLYLHGAVHSHGGAPVKRD